MTLNFTFIELCKVSLTSELVLSTVTAQVSNSLSVAVLRVILS